MHDRNLYQYAFALGAAWLLALGLATGAVAGEHRLTLPETAGKQAYVAECGSCHVAYPPQLLSAPGWARVIGGLDKHFGVDASVDPAAARTIDGYLRAYAGAERRLGTTAMRISETPWFRKEHDEVPAAAWKAPATKSAANCPACHLEAERGDYSERNVRLPAGARR